ncbi:MAG: GTP pyrophosphokinase [Phycisphaerae bacterium]
MSRGPERDDAIILAAQAHKGQVDKAGVPYITHPLRVMLRLREPVDRIVAVLHDVVEDTAVTLDDLRKAGYSQAVLAAVECLTKREDEPYEAFIERCAANPVARRVKLADLGDNMDLSRLPVIGPKDRRRMARYEKARARLMQVGR